MESRAIPEFDGSAASVRDACFGCFAKSLEFLHGRGKLIEIQHIGFLLQGQLVIGLSSIVELCFALDGIFNLANRIDQGFDFHRLLTVFIGFRVTLFRFNKDI